MLDTMYGCQMYVVHGNRYSRKHISLDPRKHEEHFWDFSWHEIASIDVPMLIDYIIAQTNQTKVYYIGLPQRFARIRKLPIRLNNYYHF